MRGNRGVDRDWSTLRNREWHPVGTARGVNTSVDGGGSQVTSAAHGDCGSSCVEGAATTDAAAINDGTNPSSGGAASGGGLQGGGGSIAGGGSIFGRAAVTEIAASSGTGNGNCGRGLGSVGGGCDCSAGYGGSDGSYETWRTDAEIGSKRSGLKAQVQERQLQRWADAEVTPTGRNASGAGTPLHEQEGTLEDLAGGSKSLKNWDQFKVNEELFGVISTFKADLSQYTTPLPSRLSPELLKRADRIANEIDRHGGGQVNDGAGSDGEYGEQGHGNYGAYGDYNAGEDEENLWSSVPRGSHDSGCYDANPGGHGWTVASPPGQWDTDFGWEASGCDGMHATAAAAETCGVSSPCADSSSAAGAIMALIAGPGAAAASTSFDIRARIAPKVQSWWRARRLAGVAVPPGAEDSLVCPFSLRVFGDVSQLVTHWAAALPRAGNADGETSTPSQAATEQFRQAAKHLRWIDMATENDLEAILSVATPRKGSVWAQVLTNLSKKTTSQIGFEQRPVSEFLLEAVGMRCWRRDQKVEHREVLECIAVGLMIHILGISQGGDAAPP
eukprot:TRINITY_DN1552_c0_g1_i1.p1 TRINITY_DN1552_c0_g1~~TRINITY_DN1552_c0_g1_i1.p1  ORF type:complete len:559 (+),score=97.76 TRINITY_DN1552_c0_g1_i1:134-1810(+)